MVENWMYERQLALTHHKIEVLLIRNRKAVQQGNVLIGELTVDLSQEAKYLEVLIDDRPNFSSHVDYACEKVAKAPLPKLCPTDVIRELCQNENPPATR